MNNMHHLHHRQAFGFGHRGREPQLGFSPTAIFNLPLPSIIPNSLPDIATQIVTSVIPTILLPTTSTKVSTSTTSRPTSTTSTSTTPTSTSKTTTTSSSSTSSTSTSQTLTSSTPASVNLVPHTQTSLVKQTISTTASTHPTSTSTAVASNGLSTGTVVGGIGAAIIGIIALIVFIVFFLRRARKRDDEITNFDPQVFRRSAVLISDPPTHEDTVARGFNPRPPTMIEKRLGSPAPPFGTQYGGPAPPAYDHGNEYYGRYSEKHGEFGPYPQQYSPGQIVNMNYSPSPMFASTIHNQSPIPSVHGPISPIKEQYHDQHNLARQPPMGANVNGNPSWGGATYPVLTRQPSAQSSSDGHSGPVPPVLVLQKGSGPANDYVDLDRSSVSPYQAAQYVEISRRLNTEVPQGLQAQDTDKNLPPLPPQSREVSPFADPESTPSSPGAQFAINRRNLDASPRPKSVDTVSSTTLDFPNTLDFPLPPSPAYTVSSRYRIDSTPPTLPEINVDSRAATTRFSGLRNAVTIPTGPGSSDELNVTAATKLPTIPSPLASSPKIPLTQNVEETSLTAAVLPADSSASSPASPAAPAVPNATKRTTTYSIYDAEDAYGGI